MGFTLDGGGTVNGNVDTLCTGDYVAIPGELLNFLPFYSNKQSNRKLLFTEKDKKACIQEILLIEIIYKLMCKKTGLTTS
jgi:hypothetical protein